jgi:hypothetical protein
MTLRTKVFVVIVAVLVAIGVVLDHSPQRSSAQEATPAAMTGHPLVGTWVVYDENVPTGAPSLTVLTSDGVVIDASANGRAGAGSWQPTGPRSGEATFVYIIDGNGGYQSYVVIRASVEVDASSDAFTARYSYTVVAPDGSILDAFEGTTEGVRVPVEPVEAGGSPLAGFPVVQVSPEATPAP